MKKGEILKRISEDKKRKPQPIKVKLDFDMNQDGAPDSYTKASKHSNKSQSTVTPDFYSQNFNDEGTNVRPLHTFNKEGDKFKKSKHTGDNHLTYGKDFEVADEHKPKVGHVKWSGDDHLFTDGGSVETTIKEVATKILEEESFKSNKKYLLEKQYLLKK
tara:strand:- start:684 stop:1163 length:480 start_codon:yes stop_codon:yes gene_type:complete